MDNVAWPNPSISGVYACTLGPAGAHTLGGLHHGGICTPTVHLLFPPVCEQLALSTCILHVQVTVLGLSVSVSVYDYSRTAGNEEASERYQQLQRNKRSKIKMEILLKRRHSRSRNWHYRGPRCVTQPIN